MTSLSSGHSNNVDAINQQTDKTNVNSSKFKLIPKVIIKKEQALDSKYKTELCKKFEETHTCPYGVRCRFAHGKEELIENIINSNYKRKKCRRFFVKGICNYGTRCNFKHFDQEYRRLCFSFYYLRKMLIELNIYDIFNNKILSYDYNNRLEAFKHVEELVYFHSFRKRMGNFT